jgi:uncharacterized protein
MDMSAPLAAYDLVSSEAGLIVALFLGFGFGFFLERAGFGSARKLAAQFYLYDMSVFKVMFTATVTAATGLWLLSAVGWLNLGEIYLVPTFLLAQLAGGLLLGIGFVIGGYCPGTSVAAIATGRIDGVSYAFGMLAGLALYAALYPAIETYTQLAAMGKITFPDLWGVARGLLVASLLAGAVGAFIGAGWIERYFAYRRPTG